MNGNSTLAAAGHSTRHNAEIKVAVEALEDKVGIDSSADTTSMDYKLSGIPATDKAVSLTGAETLTNKTLTSPKVNENVALTATASQLNVAVNNGVLGYAQYTGSQTPFAALTDLTGLSVTVTVPADGRKVKITGYTQQYSSVSTDVLTIDIREGSTVLNNSTVGGGYTNAITIAIVTPTAGSHTYKLSAARTVGTGNYTTNNAATQVSFILVEYLGGI